jgi:hypothetical protein
VIEGVDYKEGNIMTGKRDDVNPFQPSAPYSTGTIPRHGNKPPGADFEGE